MPQITEASRRQHRALRGMAEELTVLLESGPELDGPEVREGLSRIGLALKAHVEMEVDVLYPRMFEHADPEMRALAAKMAPLIKDIYDGFRMFQSAWTPEKIRKNPDTFSRQARFVLDAVRESTLREEESIYDRIDHAFAKSA